MNPTEIKIAERLTTFRNKLLPPMILLDKGHDENENILHDFCRSFVDSYFRLFEKLEGEFKPSEEMRLDLFRQCETHLEQLENLVNEARNLVEEKKSADTDRIEEIESRLKEIANQSKKIKRYDELVQNNVERDIKINRAYDKINYEDLDEIESAFEKRISRKLNELDQMVKKIHKETEVVDDLVDNAQGTLNETKNKLHEVVNLINVSQDTSGKNAVTDTLDSFGQLIGNHKKHQSNWLIALFVSSLFLCAFIVFLYFKRDFYYFFSLPVIVDFIKNFIVISFLVICIKISLTKYNSERSLVIIYENRASALRQYTKLDASIREDDFDSKNQLRIEVARNLFADPSSGYSSNNNASEINIAPIIGQLEKYSDKAI